MPITLTPSGPSYTAEDIIKAALRKIGALAKSESPSTDELTDSLQALNFMINEWGARRLMSTALIREGFPLTAGKQSYTIGPSGADFTTSVPSELTSAYLKDGLGTKRPIEILTREEFDSMQDSELVTAPPVALFFDPGATQQSPQTGTIYLYFTPDTSTTYTLYIESVKPFTEFTATTDSVTFPPAYYRALVYNLAVELAPEFGVSISKEVNDSAIESLETIESMNSVPIISGLDLPGAARGFNIYSGDMNV